jgi:hypothetical protein
LTAAALPQTLKPPNSRSCNGSIQRARIGLSIPRNPASFDPTSDPSEIYKKPQTLSSYDPTTGQLIYKDFDKSDAGKLGVLVGRVFEQRGDFGNLTRAKVAEFDDQTDEWGELKDEDKEKGKGKMKEEEEEEEVLTYEKVSKELFEVRKHVE